MLRVTLMAAGAAVIVLGAGALQSELYAAEAVVSDGTAAGVEATPPRRGAGAFAAITGARIRRDESGARECRERMNFAEYVISRPGAFLRMGSRTLFGGEKLPLCDAPATQQAAAEPAA